ncbi:class I SAM-dependent methyltransferase [Sediminibacillus halophilus]|uniref:Methyltransferase domain-containing protein n=1 Tax=Sediminibacillus halophilus TaxID=482461 RepID=A0A1G9V8P0_9BACI|nr:class I SAM-dependent methyltransferase [Sediminibacillus halophilus]SDM68544.1 Methyltransferase domain-containing protein [Sediminibacillus halophilus]
MEVAESGEKLCRFAGSTPNWWGGSLKQTERMLNTLEINKQSNVLDAGCGTGQTIAYIAQKYGCTVYGIDQHEEMIQEARKRIAGISSPVKVFKGNIEELPFEENSFDLVLSESVTAFTQIQKALKEYRRVLKPNGTLVMNEVTKIGYLEQNEESSFKAFYGFSELLDEKEWKYFLASAGFDQVRSTRIPAYKEAPGEVYHIEKLDKAYNDMLMYHQLLTEKYASKIGACLYVCYGNQLLS